MFFDPLADRADALIIRRARRLGMTALGLVDAQPNDPVVIFWKRVGNRYYGG